MHHKQFVFIGIICFLGFTNGPGDGDADRAAIRAHIERIFNAFAMRDVQTIQNTHAKDWIGFTTNARSIVHGIDGYMKSTMPNGEAAFKDSNNLILVDYKIAEIDFKFYGDVCIVPYVAEVIAGYRARLPLKFRSLDIYAKVDGQWNQVGSNIYQHPESVEDFRQKPLPPFLVDKRGLLTAREAVWRAFFTNDRQQIEKLIPEETVIFSGMKEHPFGQREHILEAAKKFGDAGTKIVRLEFPQTEIQAYGDVAILYTTYLYEIEDATGKRQFQTGRGTETFVRRKGVWLNSGWLLSADK